MACTVSVHSPQFFWVVILRRYAHIYTSLLRMFLDRARCSTSNNNNILCIDLSSWHRWARVTCSSRILKQKFKRNYSKNGFEICIFYYLIPFWSATHNVLAWYWVNSSSHHGGYKYTMRTFIMLLLQVGSCCSTVRTFGRLRRRRSVLNEFWRAAISERTKEIILIYNK